MSIIPPLKGLEITGGGGPEAQEFLEGEGRLPQSIFFLRQVSLFVFCFSNGKSGVIASNVNPFTQLVCLHSELEEHNQEQTVA